MQPLIQNFSVPADNDHDVIFTITSSASSDTLDGSTVYWRVFEQMMGSPTPAVPPVISKSSQSGDGVTILPSPPMTFVVSLSKVDTAALLRNYYHEATVVDEIGNIDTVTVGVMTVTPTENRF
jgi:hypothetical protein